jgi:hypothetical protein
MNTTVYVTQPDAGIFGAGPMREIVVRHMDGGGSYVACRPTVPVKTMYPNTTEAPGTWLWCTDCFPHGSVARMRTTRDDETNAYFPDDRLKAYRMHRGPSYAERCSSLPPLTPPQKAEARGHRPVHDGPTMGGADRWTCSLCGRAVLLYAGNVYGSAIEVDCDVEVCEDCTHAVDGHDLRGGDSYGTECFQCNREGGPCAAQDRGVSEVV